MIAANFRLKLDIPRLEANDVLSDITPAAMDFDRVKSQPTGAYSLRLGRVR